MYLKLLKQCCTLVKQSGKLNILYASQLRSLLYHLVSLSVHRTSDFSVKSHWIYESIVLLKIRISTVPSSFFLSIICLLCSIYKQLSLLKNVSIEGLIVFLL